MRIPSAETQAGTDYVDGIARGSDRSREQVICPLQRWLGYDKSQGGSMAYPDAAWERAMTVQEVMLKAFSGELHWFRAAEILGWSPRTMRRWRERYERHGLCRA